MSREERTEVLAEFSRSQSTKGVVRDVDSGMDDDEQIEGDSDEEVIMTRSQRAKRKGRAKVAPIKKKNTKAAERPRSNEVPIVMLISLKVRYAWNIRPVD